MKRQIKKKTVRLKPITPLVIVNTLKGKLKNYPDWGKLLRSKFEKKEFKDKKKILIATSTGGHKIALTTEMIFGFSLDLKGKSAK